ncbi:hypothetical protein JDV02_003029 [Purpureocillium takamizusanense]|uniref:Uncharacterized protein n=1 Tax=Purpureocillium takamizusanense TaxID=2060973 RepID=A0A9Q8QC90_9HYPO|nr:uncharacterized protein JDV02_003029 [Purpureocillium takamizusanense]UNI16602.1 hypothetical protein JDV02_003029 [Purpureocillium takamizusanense]
MRLSVFLLSQHAALLGLLLGSLGGQAQRAFNYTVPVWKRMFTIECPENIRNDCDTYWICRDRGSCDEDGQYVAYGDIIRWCKECWCEPRPEEPHKTATKRLAFATDMPVPDPPTKKRRSKDVEQQPEPKGCCILQ